jgi:hypothetical protein
MIVNADLADDVSDVEASSSGLVTAAHCFLVGSLTGAAALQFAPLHF